MFLGIGPIVGKKNGERWERGKGGDQNLLNWKPTTERGELWSIFFGFMPFRCVVEVYGEGHLIRCGRQ